MRTYKKLVIAMAMTKSLISVVGEGRSQSFELQQLLLDIQKLTQLKAILKDLQDGYKVLDAGYSAIRDISKGSFNLHKAYLDGLLAVSPSVKSYRRIADIISIQLSLIQRYKQAWALFQQDRHFRPDELSLISTVYVNLLAASVKDLTSLAGIVTDGQIRASDAERLKQIDALYTGMTQKSAFMDEVGNSTKMLSIQRASDANDLNLTKQLYGITLQ
jgi:hypothetical protein